MLSRPPSYMFNYFPAIRSVDIRAIYSITFELYAQPTPRLHRHTSIEYSGRRPGSHTKKGCLKKSVADDYTSKPQLRKHISIKQGSRRPGSHTKKGGFEKSVADDYTSKPRLCKHASIEYSSRRKGSHTKKGGVKKLVADDYTSKGGVGAASILDLPTTFLLGCQQQAKPPQGGGLKNPSGNITLALDTLHKQATHSTGLPSAG